MDIIRNEKEEQMEVGITPSPNIPEEEEETLFASPDREEGGNDLQDNSGPGTSSSKGESNPTQSHKKAKAKGKNALPRRGKNLLHPKKPIPNLPPHANLQHARAASFVLSRRFAKERLEFALNQEPWSSNEGRTSGLGNCRGKLVSSTSAKKPRACLLLRKNIKYCTQDVVAVQISEPEETSRRDIVICSAYFPGETGQEVPPASVRDLITYCRRNNKQLVLGCDANAHHMDWGSSDINTRGRTGRVDTPLPNSFRPTCLTSFFLKTLERIVDKHISEGPLRVIPLNPDQFAYTAGESTDFALHNLVGKIDHSLNNKEIALVALVKRGLESITCDWIRCMLGYGNILTSLHGDPIRLRPARGCPQGEVLSPLLWTVLVDDLLEELVVRGVGFICYEDDLAILIRGKYEDTISELLQQALNIINSWCRREQMSINLHKIVVVPFTKRRKLDKLRLPAVAGESIHFTEEVKLGREESTPALVRYTRDITLEGVHTIPFQSGPPRIIESKRNDLRILVGLLSGHCRLRNHLRKLDLEQTTDCRYCYVYDKTAEQILCSCPVLERTRFLTFGLIQLEPSDFTTIAFVKRCSLYGEL
nr:unnamed protein product [Callosobruchus analis]